MTVPTSELQSWLASQCDGAVPTWEITADSLALLSSVYRRHKRREEEARLELEELEVAREEYEAETERLSSVLRGAGSGVADSLQQGPAQSYADSLSSACSSLQLDSSLGSGLHCKLAELVARKADNIPALGKIRTDVDSLRSRQLGLHETLSRATELLSAAAREEKEKGDAAASRNSKGEFMSKKCQEYRRSHQKLEAVLAKNGGNDPRVKHSEISSLRSEVSRLEEEQQPLARQCSAFATLPPSLELAKARLADAQGELEALESSLSGAITELQLSEMDVAAAQVEAGHVRDEVAERCQKRFLDFLEEWRDEGDNQPKYLETAKELVKPERNTLQVSMRDIQMFNESLSETITREYYRVYPSLCLALKNFVKDHVDNNLEKDFYLSLTDVDMVHKVRELSTIKIGSLTKITGQVVRTHPVHPELVQGTFQCLDCQTVVEGVEQQFKFTQPTTCRNPVCNNRSRFMLDLDRSKFVDFQKVRIQEVQAELPRGCIPRSVDIVLRAEAVDTAQPGDRCEFVGSLIVVPDVGAINLPGAQAETGNRHRGEQSEGVKGLKSLGVRDLHYKMAFLACSVSTGGRTKLGTEDEEMETAEEMKSKMTADEWESVYEMSQDKNLYRNIINSLFPTIHGNDEVKRGIALMLFGGVAKTTPSGTSLRGDINVCVVGDPSTAKSQFLKIVSDFSPRAVYTSGKASSAAGLTAAVVRDEESGEFVIEAGALLLADNGVCCIDEFDKMDPRDQVAIHEAMEQQTITITKAGVKATLNARASILAAANPIGGRYDRSKSLKLNIDMTAPIMSRFDLFFILVDDCNEVTDYAIARRIIDLHTKLEESIDRSYTVEEITRYLNFARMFKPKLSHDSQELLVQQYKHLRQRDTGGSAKSSWRITVRQLESMLRLSEAFARLHCSEEVTSRHVKEAYRLLNKSIIRVDQPDVDLNEEDDAPEEIDDPMETDKENEPSEAAKKSLKLTYDKYKKMSFMLIDFIRKKEEITEGETGDGDNTPKRSDVINWFLEEQIDDIASQDEMAEQKHIVEKVVDRLIYQDQVLVALANTNKGGEEYDPFLVVHPNYVQDA